MALPVKIFLPGGKALIVGGLINVRAAACCCHTQCDCPPGLAETYTLREDLTYKGDIVVPAGAILTRGGVDEDPRPCFWTYDADPIVVSLNLQNDGGVCYWKIIWSGDGVFGGFILWRKVVSTIGPAGEYARIVTGDPAFGDNPDYQPDTIHLDP